MMAHAGMSENQACSALKQENLTRPGSIDLNSELLLRLVDKGEPWGNKGVWGGIESEKKRQVRTSGSHRGCWRMRKRP